MTQTLIHWWDEEWKPSRNLRRSFQQLPMHPLACALYDITGVEPPRSTASMYSTNEMSEADVMALQNWASENAPRAAWTGIGILDAADLLVQEAVANANIPPQDLVHHAS